jgi:adenylate cyclase
VNRFWARVERRYRPPPGDLIIEDPAVVTRIAVVAGIACVLNGIFISAVFFGFGETTAGRLTVTGTTFYLGATILFILSGRAGLFIQIMLWSSLVLNVATHVTLGGFTWSGGFLMWGIVICSMAALFLTRRQAMAMTGTYVLSGIALAFLELTLRSLRERPDPSLSAFLATDIFVISVLLVVPTIMLLMRQVFAERARSESLLLSILPEVIANRLKRGGVVADEHQSCTVLFADIVGFTDHSSLVAPDVLVSELNHIFSRFDALIAECGAEKIKTMGDGYLAVAGAPEENPAHASVMCELALRMQAAMPEINSELGLDFRLRIGLNTGRLVAGIVGTSRFSYDLWGDTVNVASRMESLGPPGRIRVTQAVVDEAGDHWVFETAETCDVKGKGPTETYLLVSKRPSHARVSG